MRVKFTIFGTPKGKGRPRFMKRGNYVKVSTPPETVNYENLVKLEYEYQCDKYFFGDKELGMTVTAYYSIAKSASKKKREQMLAGQIRPTKKPDCDNVLKAVADALNQIAYKDDAQLVETTVKKFYADEPCVVVEIYDLEDPDTMYIPGENIGIEE